MKYIFAVCLALEAIPTVYSQKATADKLLMISIAVRDMDKSEEFYTSALGLKATQDYSQGGQRWVSLSLPGGGASMSLLQAANTENLATRNCTLRPPTPSRCVRQSRLKASRQPTTSRGKPGKGRRGPHGSAWRTRTGTK